MSTATELDVDLEALFDEDTQVPCTALLHMTVANTHEVVQVEDDCPNPAKWLAVKTCGHTKTACDGHATMWLMDTKPFFCVECRQTVTAKFYPI